MKKEQKEQLIQAIKGYDSLELIKEQYNLKGLSTEEIILIEGEPGKYYQDMTIEEFAKNFEGETLTIYYKDNIQVGFVRLSYPDKRPEVLRTFQNILFDVDHPENGTISFNLNQYR